jgi:hypothetical protein
MKNFSEKRFLFLDDSEERQKLVRSTYPFVTGVRTAEECIKKLNRDWDLVSLDHDLGGRVYVPSEDTNTGMEVVRYLEKSNSDKYGVLKRIIVHTLNSPAGIEMVNRLESLGFDVIYHPFLEWGLSR